MRRWLKALVWVSALAMFAVPVAADDFTGSEREMRELSCPNGKPVPENQEPPGAGECDTATKTKYMGYVWTNNVKCNSGSTADAQGVKIYHNNTGTTSGGVGVCNDGTGTLGSKVPVQGRAVAQGSQDGGTVYIDGDKDNSNATAQGWARADGKFNGTQPTVRCGDDNGRKDATQPTASDKQDDCG